MPSGVRLTVISDSCFSGSVTRGAVPDTPTTAGHGSSTRSEIGRRRDRRRPPEGACRDRRRRTRSRRCARSSSRGAVTTSTRTTPASGRVYHGAMTYFALADHRGGRLRHLLRGPVGPARRPVGDGGLRPGTAGRGQVHVQAAQALHLRHPMLLTESRAGHRTRARCRGWCRRWCRPTPRRCSCTSVGTPARCRGRRTRSSSSSACTSRAPLSRGNTMPCSLVTTSSACCIRSTGSVAGVPASA